MANITEYITQKTQDALHECECDLKTCLTSTQLR